MYVCMYVCVYVCMYVPYFSVNFLTCEAAIDHAGESEDVANVVFVPPIFFP